MACRGLCEEGRLLPHNQCVRTRFYRPRRQQAQVSADKICGLPQVGLIQPDQTEVSRRLGRNMKEIACPSALTGVKTPGCSCPELGIQRSEQTIAAPQEPPVNQSG